MLIHIGYTKAASSWTQDMFATEGSGFYSPFYSFSDDNRVYIYDTVVKPDSLEFEPDKARPELLSEIEGDNDGVTVITTERLSGNWYSGGYDAKEIADRLHAMFPGVNILVIIREQKSMLNSVYRQYIRKGGVRSPKAFFSPREYLSYSGNAPPGYGRGPDFSFKLYEYDRIIEYYHQLFSSENVLAIPLEVLKSDTQRYISTISEFAGADTEEGFETDTSRSNVGITPFQARLQRYLNPLMNRDYINDYSIYDTRPTATICRQILKLKRITPESVKRSSAEWLEKEINDIVGDRYRESNRRTDELIEFDLEDLGYEL